MRFENGLREPLRLSASSFTRGLVMRRNRLIALERQVRDARVEWGKYAEEFFDEEDDSIPPTDLV